jgi:hypothetical protein
MQSRLVHSPSTRNMLTFTRTVGARMMMVSRSVVFSLFSLLFSLFALSLSLSPARTHTHTNTRSALTHTKHQHLLTPPPPHTHTHHHHHLTPPFLFSILARTQAGPSKDPLGWHGKHLLTGSQKEEPGKDLFTSSHQATGADQTTATVMVMQMQCTRLPSVLSTSTATNLITLSLVPLHWR